MADIADPFTPGVIQNAVGGVIPDAATLERLQGNIGSFLANPAMASALMSTGIALSQPLRWGDTGFSHASRALGSAGESVRLTEELDRKERELSSKEDLRAAQATAAEARAGAAAARAGAAGQSAEHQREKLDLARERHTLQTQVAISRAYGDYVKRTNDANDKIRKANDNAKLVQGPKATQQPEIPLLDRDTWIQQNSHLIGLPTTAGTPVGRGRGGGAAPAPPAGFVVD